MRFKYLSSNIRKAILKREMKIICGDFCTNYCKAFLPRPVVFVQDLMAGILAERVVLQSSPALSEDVLAKGSQLVFLHPSQSYCQAENDKSNYVLI